MGSTGGGLSVDSVILALFLLALTALGAIIMAYGTSLGRKFDRLFEKMDNHATHDNERFSHHSDRIARLEGTLRMKEKG